MTFFKRRPPSPIFCKYPNLRFATQRLQTEGTSRVSSPSGRESGDPQPHKPRSSVQAARGENSQHATAAPPSNTDATGCSCSFRSHASPLRTRGHIGITRAAQRSATYLRTRRGGPSDARRRELSWDRRDIRGLSHTPSRAPRLLRIAIRCALERRCSAAGHGGAARSPPCAACVSPPSRLRAATRRQPFPSRTTSPG